MSMGSLGEPVEFFFDKTWDFVQTKGGGGGGVSPNPNFLKPKPHGNFVT